MTHEELARKILEYQITERQVPITAKRFNRFAEKVSRGSKIPLGKTKKFLKQYVWFPEKKV